MSKQPLFEKTIELINAANSEDPNTEMADDKEWPKELLYSHRMENMIQRFAPDADEVQKIAVHGQHIQRWQSPRSDYTMDRKGYHQWRTNLYKFHAEQTCLLMQQAGYDELSIERVKLAIGKKNLKSNIDTQMLENIAALVFIEHYMQAFVDKYPEYDEAKWIDIILKTWKKMTESAQQFALSGAIKLPEPLIPLIKKSIT
ncbi:MAG: DUF4202 domain-containing protein [Pseudomonadota bacterium]